MSGVAVAGALASGLLAAAPGCPADADGAWAHVVESPRYVIAYRTRPAAVAVGEHFAVELLVCPRGGAPAPDAVRVDAYMPDHRHGMNYRPVVTAEAAGRYRAQGLLLHMPGRWDLVFEVRAPGGGERLVHRIDLE